MILKTVEDVKKALIDLDLIYYQDKINKKDYENAKQDLYIYQYKLEKNIEDLTT